MANVLLKKIKFVWTTFLFTVRIQGSSSSRSQSKPEAFQNSISFIIFVPPILVDPSRSVTSTAFQPCMSYTGAEIFW